MKMKLIDKWHEILSNQTEESFSSFWDEYSTTEKRIYEDILENYKRPFSGTIKELTEKYNTTDVLFMGFLDGINSSLEKNIDLNEIHEDSTINLLIDYEKLFYNMLEAKADYLFTLPQWESILSPEKRNEITKTQKRSKTIVKNKKIGRNDPCPCGSGEKYKKCCLNIEKQ